MIKFPQYVGLKLPHDVVEAAKQQAEAEDRTFSAYLRRIIVQAVQPKATARHDVESDNR